MLECCTTELEGVEQGSNATHWWWNYNKTSTDNTTIGIQKQEASAIEASSGAPGQAILLATAAVVVPGVLLLLQ
jgi:hypothetical protein